MQEVVRSFVLPGECDINHPHLTTPRAPNALVLPCLCGERLGEGDCHHLMQRELTHFLDEPLFLFMQKKRGLLKIKNDEARSHINGWDDTQRLRAR